MISFTSRWRGARTNGVCRVTKCLLAAAAKHLTRAKLVTTDTYGSARPKNYDARGCLRLAHTPLFSVWVSKRRLNGKTFGERFFADDTAVLVRELSRVARRVAGAAKYPKVT
ncbi:hypothetical protein ACI65C_000569 [Semiaphis heraclei]